MATENAKRLKVSIIIPVFNERKTVLLILDKVLAADVLGLDKEVIIIDDCSTDGTRDLLANINNPLVRLFFHDKNKGKGAAVKTGFSKLTGDIVIIQDADLEYDPNDYKFCLKPIIDGTSSVVYGSRILNKNNLYGHWQFFIGGKFITNLTNILYKVKLTDEPIDIKGDKFEWEPEITAKILKSGIQITEVPINYYPRTLDEGKHIRFKDGIIAAWILIKYKFIND